MPKTHTFDLTRLIAVVLLVIACVPPAYAGLFKCTDEHNRIYYQDKPCQDLISTRLPSSLAGLAGKEEERAFLWKAASDKGTLYLLGALQYGTQSLYPLPQIVMDAFNNSSVVVVEANLDNFDEKERAAVLKGKGRYEDKTTLETHVKPVTWSKTVEMGKKLGINEEVLNQYTPWMAALLLTAESLKQAGYSADLGLIQTFTKESQGKKPVMELENVEEQIKTLDGLSNLEQEQLLLQTLQDLGRAPDIYRNKADAWKKGDVEAMDMLTRQSYDTGQTSEALFKTFYEDRNERMANRLQDLASDEKSYFVVVGAGYLGGDQGLLKLLQDKGFKVTQP